jgi:hypothetical protein
MCPGEREKSLYIRFTETREFEEIVMSRNSNRYLNRYDCTAIAALIRWGGLCGGLGFCVLAWAKAGEEALPSDLAPVMIGVVQRDAAPLYRVSAERGDIGPRTWPWAGRCDLVRRP